MTFISRRGWSRGLSCLLLWSIFIGPWPARDVPPPAAEERGANRGPARLSRGNRSDGPIRVGVATVDLVPPRPTPLAGYIGGVARPFVGINSPCRARALTVVGPGAGVTILAADLLLVDERLARAVLARVGLPRDQVYFTATHTHGGPGGWGVHPLERLVAGTYDPGEFARLADRLAGAVSRSRAATVPAEVAFAAVEVPGMQRNRIIPGGPTNATLAAWTFRATAPLPGRPGARPALATLAVFGAHATVAHPDPPRLGADYPGAFAAELARRADAGEVLFAAGTVGDSGPVRGEAPNERLLAEAYGRGLAARLAPALSSAEFRADAVLANVAVDVPLPPVQVPCGSAGLRFSPLATWWVGRARTHLHALRLGPAILVGFPGDYAGELARSLDAEVPVVATSFAGDYKGYLVSAATFRARSCYETRWMSFFGPHLGDHLTAVARGLVDDLATAAPRRARGPAGVRLGRDGLRLGAPPRPE